MVGIAHDNIINQRASKVFRKFVLKSADLADYHFPFTLFCDGEWRVESPIRNFGNVLPLLKMVDTVTGTDNESATGGNRNDRPIRPPAAPQYNQSNGAGFSSLYKN